MITGDKLETAENVGVASRLLHDDGERFYFTDIEPGQAAKSVRNVYKIMKQKIRMNKQAGQHEDDSDDSDFEREDSKQQVKEETKRDQNSSANQIEPMNANQIMDSRTTKSQPKVLYDKGMIDDLFNPQKKLKITEKKLFIKQIVMNSSINTSFNPSKIRALENADINFEVVIEGECLTLMLQDENKKVFGKIIKNANVVLV